MQKICPVCSTAVAAAAAAGAGAGAGGAGGAALYQNIILYKIRSLLSRDETAQHAVEDTADTTYTLLYSTVILILLYSI